jgi:hypothetical protein
MSVTLIVAVNARTGTPMVKEGLPRSQGTSQAICSEFSRTFDPIFVGVSKLNSHTYMSGLSSSLEKFWQVSDAIVKLVELSQDDIRTLLD